MALKTRIKKEQIENIGTAAKVMVTGASSSGVHLIDTSDLDSSVISSVTLGTVAASKIVTADGAGKITLAANEIEGSAFDIDGGTIDGVTMATSDITISNTKTLDTSAGTLTTSGAQDLAIVKSGIAGMDANSDFGNFKVTAQNLQADALTIAGGVVFTDNAGNLSEDSDMTFSGNTLSITRLDVNHADAIDLSTQASNIDLKDSETSGLVIKDAQGALLTVDTQNNKVIVNQGLEVSSSQTVNMGGNVVGGVGTPTSEDHAAPKSYVDQVIQGINAKKSVQARTTAAIASAHSDGYKAKAPSGQLSNASDASQTGDAYGITDRSILIKHTESGGSAVYQDGPLDALFDGIKPRRGDRVALMKEDDAFAGFNGIYEVVIPGLDSGSTVSKIEIDFSYLNANVNTTAATREALHGKYIMFELLDGSSEKFRIAFSSTQSAAASQTNSFTLNAGTGVREATLFLQLSGGGFRTQTDLANDVYALFGTVPGLNGSNDLQNFSRTQAAGGNGGGANLKVGFARQASGSPSIASDLRFETNLRDEFGRYFDAANEGPAVLHDNHMPSACPWVLVRAEDADGLGDNREFGGGTFCFVEMGATFADTGHIVSSDGMLSPASSYQELPAFTWVQFSSAGVIEGGDGILKSGNALLADLEPSAGLKLIGASAGSRKIGVEPNDFAGTGLEDDGSDNLRLAAQGNGIAGGNGAVLSVDLDANGGLEFNGSAIRLEAAVAGAGIVHTSGVLSLDAGNGVELSGDTLQLDIAANKGVQIAGSELSLILDGTSLTQSGSGLKVDKVGAVELEYVSIFTHSIGSPGTANEAKEAEMAGLSGIASDAADLNLSSNPSAVHLNGLKLIKRVNGSGNGVHADADFCFLDDGSGIKVVFASGILEAGDAVQIEIYEH